MVMPKDQETPDQETPSVLFRSLDCVKDAPNLEPLLGNWLFNDSLVMIAGEPGIKKTTLMYDLGMSLVDNVEFLGIKPGNPQVRVIYLDLESGESLIKTRIESGRGYPKNVDNFIIVNNPELTFMSIEPYITEFLRDKDKMVTVVFVDCLRAAFQMFNENDNAEASKHMKYLRKAMNKWKPCVIIVVHHSSKSELSGTKKAAGAGARAALADILWNFEHQEDWPEDVFKWTIPKNRMVDDHFETFVRAQEYEFEICNAPDNVDIAKYSCGVRKFKLQERILNLLVPDYVIDAELLERQAKCTHQQLYRALSVLTARGDVRKVSRGKYMLNHVSQDNDDNNT